MMLLQLSHADRAPTEHDATVIRIAVGDQVYEIRPHRDGGIKLSSVEPISARIIIEPLAGNTVIIKQAR